MRIYISISLIVMLLYILRHFIFSINRISTAQVFKYQDIMGSELPSVTVIVPMHNEQRVAHNILDNLVHAVYPRNRFEVMPINDHSEDETKNIIDRYAKKYSFIRPLHRNSGKRGKPAALNDAMKIAKGDIIVVFDADYLPPQGIIRDMVVSFKDPEVGAVMGRVIPENANVNLLTKLLALERSAGYQVDQQARQNMGLVPQYGGTVGAFRKDIAIAVGGFNPDILTEDTELTFKLIMNGWKVYYNNRLECYEEVPEDWDVRARQVRRWSRGHTQVMFKYLIPWLKSTHIGWREKIDGVLVLFIYMVPVVLSIGILDVTALFFLDKVQIFESIFIFLAVSGFNLFGNFAPFYQIGTALIIDGFTDRIKLLPFIIFTFLFNLYNCTLGSVDAIIDQFKKREIIWAKTERFRK
jgi:cellulose synthase/poly-beta-1,6-N-acetylglucosamine synthase-like glycosyltransferase